MGLDLVLERFSDTSNSTTGLLFDGATFECFTLEDEYRTVKVKGETRIPDGRYELRLRKEVTPLTQRYRARFPGWFSWHIEICGVPGFTCVYIHTGNRETETYGCVLVGDSLNNNQVADAFLGNSVEAYARLYKKVAAALDRGQVFINVRSRSHG